MFRILNPQAGTKWRQRLTWPAALSCSFVSPC